MGLISTRTFLGSRMYEWGNRLREIVRERQKESVGERELERARKKESSVFR